MKQTMRFVGVLIYAVCIAVATNALAEEGTINAYSPWEGSGQIYPTGPNQATFVGAFRGVMFVEKDDGLVNAGNIICPTVLTIDLEDGSQVGHGRCTMSNTDGARVFVEWRCSGTHLRGCDGDFTLTGGTGDFEGITGGGQLLARSAVHEITALIPGNIVQKAAAGIAIWRNLHYKIPE